MENNEVTQQQKKTCINNTMDDADGSTTNDEESDFGLNFSDEEMEKMVKQIHKNFRKKEAKKKTEK